MSKHFIGKMEKVVRDEGQSIENWILSYLKEGFLKEIKENNYNICEYFESVYDKKFIIIENEIYRILKIESENVFRSSKNEDSTIDFEIIYYDWNCSFKEAMELALKNSED